MADDFRALPYQWTAAWSTNNAAPWVELFTPDGLYVDHAFQIRRAGHAILEKHHNIWRAANPDFVMTVDEASPLWWRDVDETKGNAKCSFRTMNKGTNTGDLPRKKASGREFQFSGVIDLVIEAGRIKELNEWYSWNFDQSMSADQYHTLSS